MDPSDLEPTDSAPPRGKLKILLGYAAGVGKTHAMLETAQRRRSEGIDVVVGYVATHGRPEMNALLHGLEIIPPHYNTYQGQTQAALDLEAIEQRRPQLVLVDELAQRNPPGVRHARRCQDVIDLLDAGIDVTTTVNIQHFESVKDIVAQITGVTVDETIPDDFLDTADEIELIDLPINELLERYEAGKIHLVEVDSAQSRRFFRPGNLAALRELALRRTADRVDEEMRAYMASHAISGPWPAGERILVCVSPSPLSERLVRTGRRLARRLNAEWIAAYVEPAGHGQLSESDRDRVVHTLALAENLGAQVVRLSGRAVADTLVSYARRHNVTKIVAGKPYQPRWREVLQGGSLIDRILRLSQDLDVYVISSPPAPDAPRERVSQVPRPGAAWRDYLLSMALVGLATLIGLPFRPTINPTNLVMPYLVAVILAGFWLGRYPAIVASLLSVIAFDIIFVPPVYTFGVADAEYFLTFVGFLAVGLVISTLTARAADQEQAARRRERQTAALYDLSQKLAALTEIADIAQAAVNQVEPTAGHAAGLFLPDGNKQMVLQAQTAGFALETESAAVAAWVFRHGQPAGRHTDTLTSVGAHFLPLRTAGQAVGVLSVCVPARPSILSVEERRLLVSMASQIALAVDKARLAERARQTRLLEETERLQTALLNSISHDLRSPLATITGALSSLHDDTHLLSPAAQRELVETAWAEARRLNRLVGNLLDMTRLESGTLKVVRQPADVQDLVGSALAQLPNRLRGRPLEVQLAPDLPLVDLDFTLMIQVLVNLIDNALKYAPPEEPIEISGRQLPGGEVVVSVSDRGAGLPDTELEHVFDRFFRIEDKGIGGTGLGLSIAKGIVEAHGGRVWAENRIGGGASFSFTLSAVPNPAPA